MSEKYVIGLDYGTLEARALLVRVSDGGTAAATAFRYPHGILTEALPEGEHLEKDWVLGCAEDYTDALYELVRTLLEQSGVEPAAICAVGIDATSYTMVPCDGTGTALSTLPAFKNEKHAYIKVWKHHGAARFADKVNELARLRGEPFLRRCGGQISCEWAIPKILELREEAPEVYAQAAAICDLGEWLTWQLTGQRVWSVASQGFKCLWYDDLGYPPAAFLNELGDGFAAELKAKLFGPVSFLDRPCGTLCPAMADRLGLQVGTPVAAPLLDGHSADIAVGMDGPETAHLTLGTSIVLSFADSSLREIPGLCGVAWGGFFPGRYCYDSGQCSAGDALDWFIRTGVPAEYRDEAMKAGISLHTLLCDKINQPEKNGLTALDWWNGNRSVLCDASLRGAILGLGLDTKPEDIYCAMLQGIACGSRRIIEQCARHGADIRFMLFSGGIPRKNRFFMTQYANLLGFPLRVALGTELPALGTAILTASAAGLYPSLAAAMRAMSVKDFTEYRPEEALRGDYEAIYRRWSRYHDLLGGVDRPR